MPTVTIKGKIFALPPLNTGQMRRNLDPILEKIRNLQVAAETAPTDPKALFEMALQTREVQRSQAEIVAMAIGNQYPHFTLDDLDSLEVQEVTVIFNQVLSVTMGGRTPGEGIPPA